MGLRRLYRGDSDSHADNAFANIVANISDSFFVEHDRYRCVRRKTSQLGDEVGDCHAGAISARSRLYSAVASA